MNDKTPTIEMDLPADSIFRKLESAAISNEIKTVETDLGDEEYNKMMSDFITKARIQSSQISNISPNTPQQKIKTIREQLADGRKPLKFRKGFLNSSNGNSLG